MAINLIPVSSSNIKAIGYENATLVIKFKNGAKYEYYDVPEIVWLSLKSASSIGSYYHANIKGVYNSSKI